MSWTEMILTLGRGRADTGPEFRQTPDLVTLGVHPGAAPSTKPPVRIYLGSEDAQYRAERVFVYSVEKHRDPGRVYEIHLLKNLRGFSRQRWRTDFTNYRFAIPEFAARHGRAIYNDVDQIYLADPAQLFDLDMDQHGYLSVSANDTSVMLIDCERMAPYWHREAAVAGTKATLLAAAASVDGLWGELDAEWNSRDLAEYQPGRSKCLHYTALHTQPWRPSPELYSYHDHPLANLWSALEEEAEIIGFRVFTAHQPSSRCVEIVEQHRLASREAREPEALTIDTAAANMLAREPLESALECFVGSLPGACDAFLGSAELTSFDLAGENPSWPQRSFDCVAAVNLLERLPAADVPWLLDELFSRARSAVYIAVRCGPSAELLPDGGNLHACIRPPSWWHEQARAAAARYPGLRWHLDALEAFAGADAKVTAYQAEPRSAADDDPRVWVLLSSKGGDNAQLLNLASSLGWPYEIKQLAFNSLHVCPGVVLGATLASLDEAASDPIAPPWPEVVVAAGKRSVPVARWIRARSGGKTRLVHIGRPWAPLEWFDLIITTPQYRLPARPNVLHNTLPLNDVDAERLRAAATDSTWSSRIEILPHPRIAVLVGGNSSSHLLTVAAASRLGELATTAASEAGGSLMITTSPRTPVVAADALEAALSGNVLMHRWQPEADNPYDAFLAAADAFIVTGDSASMIAEACSTANPVTIYPVPRRLELVPAIQSVLERLSRWRSGRVSYRGTPKQQDPLDRFYDGLVDAGLITPARNLTAYHEAIEALGLANTAGRPPPTARSPRPNDMQRAVGRVRRLVASSQRRVDHVD